VEAYAGGPKRVYASLREAMLPASVAVSQLPATLVRYRDKTGFLEFLAEAALFLPCWPGRPGQSRNIA
jgi:hypothetical protein